MTDKELEIKAKEYANKTEFTEYDNPSLAESLDISEEIKQAYIDGGKELQEENEQLKQEKAEYIKMLKDWEKLVCVNLSEGCCPSCEVCLFGELKEKTESIKRAE